MALIICPECGKEISDKASACPHCGNPMQAIFEKSEEPAPQVNHDEEEFNKYMLLARRALEDNNNENAGKYYDLALQKNPMNWEAAFFQVYCRAMECKIAQIQSASNSVANCLNNVLTLIHNEAPENEQSNAVNTVVRYCSKAALMLFGGAKGHYDGIDSSIKSNYTQEFVNNGMAARNILYTCGTQIDSIFSEKPEIARAAADAWKAGIAVHEQLLPYFADEAGNRNIMASYALKVGKYDAGYAKERAYQEKKKALESEIATLSRTISTTPTTGKWGVCIFFVICGVIMLLCGLMMGYGGTWATVIGLVLMILGFCGKPNTQVIEANRQTVAAAQRELEKKQAELQSLTH